MSLLNPSGRAMATVSVPSHAYCDTFMLAAASFRDIARAYPSFRERIEHVKRARERENGAAPAPAPNAHANERASGEGDRINGGTQPRAAYDA